MSDNESSVKKVVFLYDRSGLMAQPWLLAGYECWCFDGQHPDGITREGNLVKVGMWFYPDSIEAHADYISKLVGSNVYMVFGFPECTHLAVSGAAHFAAKLRKDPDIQNNAVKLARMVELVGQRCGCRWAAENPVSVLATKWRKPDFSFHPYQYGGYLPTDDTHPEWPEYIAPRDAYPKKTCIWCSVDFVVPKFLPVPCPPGFSAQHNKLGGKSLKTKNIRSATPRGFAAAVFEANHGN